MLSDCLCCRYGNQKLETLDYLFLTMEDRISLDKSMTRFSHADWHCDKLKKFTQANNERQNSERLVTESLRLMDETASQVQKAEQDVKKKFEHRLEDLKFWKNEIDTKLDEISGETDYLDSFKRRLESALSNYELLKDFSEKCLASRDQRKGIELVHDNVQIELLKEWDVIDGGRTLLLRTIEQTNEQLRRNRKARYNLRKDLSDKLDGMNIDKYCLEMNKHLSMLEFHPDAVIVPPNSVSYDDWQNFSNGNIVKAESERETSKNLRSLIDGILQQTCNDIKKQVGIADLAFSQRITEMRDTKGKLGDSLNLVQQQISELEENIVRLEMGIVDKEKPLKLAETRLEQRNHRPNMELCHGPLQYRLIQEVNELRLNLKELHNSLYVAQKTLKKMLQIQRDLEADIENKTNSLFIDEVECVGIRKSMNIQFY
ncbi:tektin-1-like [Argonauta hians]